MSHTDMLRWIAYYVMNIASLPAKKGRETVQIVASDHPKQVTIMRTGKDHLDALSRCVRAGAKKLPLRKH